MGDSYLWLSYEVSFYVALGQIYVIILGLWLMKAYGLEFVEE